MKHIFSLYSIFSLFLATPLFIGCEAESLNKFKEAIDKGQIGTIDDRDTNDDGDNNNL